MSAYIAETELDDEYEEWMELIREARDLGISIEEIREFFQNHS